MGKFENENFLILLVSDLLIFTLANFPIKLASCEYTRHSH
jgi:hypothetical protein